MSQRIEVSALVPWTRAILRLTRVRPPRRAIEEAFEGALRTGNIDALVTAYRVCPRLLEVLSTHPTYLDRLRPVLDRSKDHSLAESVGIRLPSEHVRLGGLSKREIEVLSYVSQGLSNKDIGKALFITETTVKVHVRNICRKLDVSHSHRGRDARGRTWDIISRAAAADSAESRAAGTARGSRRRRRRGAAGRGGRGARGRGGEHARSPIVSASSMPAVQRRRAAADREVGIAHLRRHRAGALAAAGQVVGDAFRHAAELGVEDLPSRRCRARTSPPG